MKQGRQHHARQRKEAWIRYESELAEYDRRKSQREVEERRTASTPYDKIREALEELRATAHPGEKYEQLRDLLRSTAPRTHEERTQSRLPARSTTHRQEDQNQRKSAFERLGASGSHNRESRRDHSQGHRVEQPRKTKSRAPAQTASQNYSHQNDSWPEGGAESEFKEARTHDDSPVLQTDLRQYDYLTSSNRPTTLSMMAKLNQDSGSEYIHNQLN